ncbi:MAG: hypothetical protein ACRDQA_23820, partial [Nocardioidaceae bacterium]
GIGGALVEHIVQKSQQRGRPVLLGEASYDFERRDDHPYRRFAEKHGFALASTEVWRRLDLPVREAQLQAWADEAAAHHADYAVETYAGPVPERLLASYCDVSNQLAVDAPSGDIDFEPEAMTPRLWREREAKLEEQGRTLVNTLALDKGGDVVGVTTLVVPEHDKPKVYQWTTQVLAGHRGHRLGLAIKAHNLLTLQRTYPDRTMILTCNEESNGPMVDINKRMGFRPVEILGEFQRKL